MLLIRLLKNSTILIIITIILYSFTTQDSYKFNTIKPLPPFPKKIHITNNEVKLGRYLFYDPILSKDSSISCATCHQQKFAFSENKKFSNDFMGEKLSRNTLPLFNLIWSNSFFWDGKSKTLEEQLNHPIKNEMGSSWDEIIRKLNYSSFYKKLFQQTYNSKKIDITKVINALSQFERTLISNNSKYDKVLRGEEKFTKDEYQGFVLINDQSMADCLHCHPTDGATLATTGRFSNNGLDNFLNTSEYRDLGRGGVTNQDKDIGLFKIPSLRNIALTSPYMHDGRFKTLEEVLDFYSEGVNNSINVDSKMTKSHIGGVKLNEIEKKQILAFLKTLTDSSFIKNEKYSNPFN